MPDHPCPKCQAEMTEGFALDDAETRSTPTLWIAGKPQTTWMGNVKTGAAAPKPLAAWRCTRCSFVELYAP